METYRYSGLRNLLHGPGDYERTTSLFKIVKKQGDGSALIDPRLVQEITQAVNAVHAVKEKHLLIIYRPHDAENYNVFFPENYKGCVFLSGKYSKIDQSGLSLTINGIENAKDISKDKNTLIIPLDEIIDIIPKDNVGHSDAKLRLFNFYSLDYGKKGHHIYDIIHTDPVNAYLEAKYSSNLPLRLSSIRDLYAGMQFNKGRGEGDGDLY
jgi:hypothetical protein